MQPKRILLKLSGELLKGPQDHGVEASACLALAEALKATQESGIQIGIVIGGGNIFRGVNSQKLNIHRSPADHMGMLATMINGIAIQQSLESVGCRAHVMSALECPKAVEPYNWHRAMEYLNKGEIVVFVGGTGNPYFTTDTAAALRASEIEADYLLKATKVDGAYDKDPVTHSDAKKFSTLTYAETLAENLKVMDPTSIALCRSSSIPILIFNMKLLIEKKLKDFQTIKDQGTLIN